MKYHKLHKTSFRQSITFLLLMIVGITLPIACSDLRGPEIISNKQLENTQIDIQDATLTVNGVPLDNQNFENLSTGGLGAISIMAGEYGIFKVAPRQFDGAIKTGKIDGNNLSFEINELNVELSSSSEILKGISNSSLWVSHNREIAEATSKFPPMLNTHENANAPMDPPPPPSPAEAQKSEDGDFFVVVEKMPELIGGMRALQSKIEYPALAHRTGIEGRVTVQFIVNENGDVENAEVVRGIGGGADKEALRVVQQAKFEPGMQRGQPVRVQYALSVNFKLENSGFTTSGDMELIPDQMIINIEKNGASVTGVVKDMDGNPLSGVNVVVNETNKGISTDPNGKFTIRNVDRNNLTLTYSHVGYKNTTVNYEF